MNYSKTKFCQILTALLFLSISVFGQTSLEELNHELRSTLINLKKAPNQTPFLYDMSSHMISHEYYNTYNDTTLMSSNLFYTMYEEMRSSAYDTTVLIPSDSVLASISRVASNDTVFMSILDADYAIFTDSAFANDGEYYDFTEDTITDVVSRLQEPFLTKGVFISSIHKPISYFRKVVYVLDSNYIFARNNLLADYSASDLDPNYARWKVDFGDGVGWREFNPKTRNIYVVNYPDTGLYYISTAIFRCDPHPLCDTFPTKLSKTAIYILNNRLPIEPDLTYEFTNITVGLYKGCGEVVGGTYIPSRPIIIIEGIDLSNTRFIPEMYDDYVVNASKRLSELIGSGYDFYFVNFNNSKIDMRDNARGVIELIDYLKSIMVTNEQFVVVGESMGGIIARYALTYMETNTYKSDPGAVRPDQLHNTRLLITNDSPHQGAYVPIAYQMLYRDIANSIIVKILRKGKRMFPMLDKLDEMAQLLESVAVQQLLAYHVDAVGPHVERDSFMDDLISMNSSNNGYPQYCKLFAITDGLLTGQHQLKTNDAILAPGEKMFNLFVRAKAILFRSLKVNVMTFNLDLFAVDKNNVNLKLLEVTEIVGSKIKIKGCLRKLLRLNVLAFINCAVTSINLPPLNSATSVTENYETTPGGIFPAYNLISDSFNPKDIDLLFFTGKFNIDKANGNFNFVGSTASWLPFQFFITPEIEINMSMPYFSFGFIPVQSAIDLDYYKSQNFPPDDSLLSTPVQLKLLYYSPFHVISGFQNFNVSYPAGVDPSLGNRNWSHGYFNNIIIDTNTNTGFITREIGDEIIYLNNLDLGQREADFRFKTVQIGVNNPHYKYVDALPLTPYPILNGTYSKDIAFRFIEPSIVSIFYEVDYIDGDNKFVEGSLNVEQITIEVCEPLRPFVGNSTSTDLQDFDSASNILVYPNPFKNSLVLLNLDNNEDYIVSIYNSFGQLLSRYHISDFEGTSFTIDTNEFIANGVYFMQIENTNGLYVNKKLIKLD